MTFCDTNAGTADLEDVKITGEQMCGGDAEGEEVDREDLEDKVHTLTALLDVVEEVDKHTSSGQDMRVYAMLYYLGLNGESSVKSVHLELIRTPCY
jgi:hypothetical protein